MVAGQKVYRGEVGITMDATRGLFTMVGDGIATGISVDGEVMVRVGDTLLKGGGFVATKAEAKQQIVDQLVRIVGVVQRQIDTLRDEILHELLTTEEAAA